MTLKLFRYTAIGAGWMALWGTMGWSIVMVHEEIKKKVTGG